MPPRRRPETAPARNQYDSVVLTQHLASYANYLQAERGMSPRTIKAYASDLAQFHEWFRLRDRGPLRDLQVAAFSEYVRHLFDRNLAPTSVARHLVAVKMFFRFLVLEGEVQDSVADLVNSPKLWQHLPKVLSPDMVDRLIDAPNRDDAWYLRDRAILTVLYATGCRATEVCDLKKRDIYLEEGYCRCVGKGNKERIVSLNPVARAAIEAYLAGERIKLAGSEQPELFLSRRGKPLSRITVWKLIKRYARRIGASDEVSPHTLRHSFATHMLAGGAEIRALQEMLGHASIRTTQIYTHLDHTRLKTVHEQCHPRG